MATGLVAGYGTFAVMAGRFLFPAREGNAWMLVGVADELEPGASIPFTSPTGVQVVITRRAESVPVALPPAEDFLALSSVCPHLGCRVHWEQQNDRYFCPCHNGTFDPLGNPTGGPPAEENTPLPVYSLQVENGLLYIEMPIESVVPPEAVADASTPSRVARGRQGRLA
jgi:Rieske Fe-S protein